MIRINCKLPDIMINSDMFFNYKDKRCKYDMLDDEITLKDLRNMKNVLNELKISNKLSWNKYKPIIIKAKIIGK